MHNNCSSQIKSSQINSIQYLRGIAAIAIVLRHLSDRTYKYNIIAPGFNGIDMGIWGVDLFFVISGFVMVYITDANRAEPRYVFNFWIRRYLRISPIYYIMTGVMLLIAIYIPGSTELDPGFEHTVNSLLYIPSDNIAPVLGVGWTLNYEMYFYLIFGLVLFLPKNYQVSAMAVWLTSSVLFGFFYNGNNAIVLEITNPLLFEFLIGVFIGRSFREGKILPIFYAVVLLSLAFITLLLAEIFDTSREFRVLCFGLPSAGLVWSLISLESVRVIKFDAKLPLLAGDVSYSLYLVHIIVIAAYGKMITKFYLFDYVNGYILLIGDFIACFFVAILMFKLIEKPLHSSVSKRIKI